MGRLELALSEEGRSGGLPSTPCFTGSPNKKTGCAAPWSVPALPFDLILLPNSEKVIPITLLPTPSCVRSAWKAEMLLKHFCNNCGVIARNRISGLHLAAVGIKTAHAHHIHFGFQSA